MRVGCGQPFHAGADFGSDDGHSDDDCGADDSQRQFDQ
jgi:hypothetical protein